jgi:hypothetical protein
MYVLLQAIIGFLLYEGRVTYRALQEIFRIEGTFLEAVRDELLFKRFAIDENGIGLVWTGDVHPAAYPTVADTVVRPAPTPAGLISAVPSTEAGHHGSATPSVQSTHLIYTLSGDVLFDSLVHVIL